VDKTEFRARASRLEEIGKIIEKLPAEVRHDAFELLKAYTTGRSAAPKEGAGSGEDTPATGEGDDVAFFGSFEHDRPSDNAKLIAADFYREYGLEPFSFEDVRAKANAFGLTIPARLETLTIAKQNGKNLFRSAGRGKIAPTVHGEKYFREKYNVRKGVKTRPVEQT
jgi:hypothetical protein